MSYIIDGYTAVVNIVALEVGSSWMASEFSNCVKQLAYIIMTNRKSAGSHSYVHSKNSQ